MDGHLRLEGAEDVFQKKGSFVGISYCWGMGMPYRQVSGRAFSWRRKSWQKRRRREWGWMKDGQSLVNGSGRFLRKKGRPGDSHREGVGRLKPLKEG